MKKNWITILLILFVPIVAYLAFSKTSNTSAKVPAPDTGAYLAGKPQVLKFTSTMCLDCQKMNKIFKEIFPKYEGEIVLTEIPVQDRNDFSNAQIEKYNVTLVPTIILLDSQGHQTKRIEGAIEQEEMDTYLKGLK